MWNKYRHSVWIWLPPLLGAAFYFLLVPTGLASPARLTAAITLWIAIWWFTEALPIGITSLLPILLLPLAGVLTVQEACKAYADKTIFLFLGAFMIAAAIEKWQLHQRFAFATIRLFGSQPKRLVGGFMISAALMSLWISNTAVALMMLPVAVSVIAAVKTNNEALDAKTQSNFAICMVLGVAYAASIGGLGMIIGTPPNALLAAFVHQEYGQTLSFNSWMKFGIPITLLFLPLTWWLLTHLFFPLPSKTLSGTQTAIHDASKRLGRLKSSEKRVLIVFVMTAGLWVFRPLLAKLPGLWFLTRVDDTSIALLGAVLLCALPSRELSSPRLLVWEDAVRIPWHILFLFGGGLTLATALEKSGMAQFIGQQFLGLELPTLPLIILITTVIVFFGEIASNTATVATFLPIIASIAKALAVPPMLLLVPATLAASLSFMIPVGTPPNALAFATGFIKMPQMLRVGLLLDFIAVVLVSTMTYLILM